MDSVSDLNPEDTPEREELLGRAILTMAQAKFDDQNVTSEMIHSVVNIVGSRINDLSNNTLSLLCARSLQSNWRKTASLGALRLWDDQKVNDFINNASILQGKSKRIEGLDLFKVEEYLRLLSHYDGLAPAGSVRRAEQTSMILQFTKQVVAHGSPEVLSKMVLDIKGDLTGISLPYVHDESLRGLLLNPGRHRGALMELVTQRRIFDGENLSALLEMSATSALREGAL